MYFLSYFVWTLTEENSEKATHPASSTLQNARSHSDQPQQHHGYSPPPLTPFPWSLPPPLLQTLSKKNIDVDLSRKWSRRFNKQHVQHGTHTLVGNVKSTCHMRSV